MVEEAAVSGLLLLLLLLLTEVVSMAWTGSVLVSDRAWAKFFHKSGRILCLAISSSLEVSVMTDYFMVVLSCCKLE